MICHSASPVSLRGRSRRPACPAETVPGGARPVLVGRAVPRSRPRGKAVPGIRGARERRTVGGTPPGAFLSRCRRAGAPRCDVVPPTQGCSPSTVRPGIGPGSGPSPRTVAGFFRGRSPCHRRPPVLGVHRGRVRRSPHVSATQPEGIERRSVPLAQGTRHRLSRIVMHCLASVSEPGPERTGGASDSVADRCRGSC